jgi:hypothetical protein
LALRNEFISMIKYQIETELSVEEFTEVLINSTLGERRPVSEPDRIAKMLEHGNLIITARHNWKISWSFKVVNRLFVLYLLI